MDMSENKQQRVLFIPATDNLHLTSLLGKDKTKEDENFI
jgi:hypothetical protein